MSEYRKRRNLLRKKRMVVDMKMVGRRRWKGDGGASLCRGVVSLL